jgi:hypothetical protein
MKKKKLKEEKHISSKTMEYTMDNEFDEEEEENDGELMNEHNEEEEEEEEHEHVFCFIQSSF